MVDLSSNRLHGPIPSLIFQQAWNLISFNVSNNPLRFYSLFLFVVLPRYDTWIFPSIISVVVYLVDLGSVPNCRYFVLVTITCQDCFHKMSLPHSKTFHYLEISLYGALSDGIANLTNLTSLDLSYNNLSGVLPSPSWEALQVETPTP
ncbi:hypothetical protein M0R45_029884 [Rubus argutus]|uniref:Uncharacterized protein n=1 Tax=Rubus argutus TaxID=59490 RepID=A0AAW1WCH1_RUBAR